MSPKHRAFAHHYAGTLHATEAAIAAGYSPRSAHDAGSRLLKRADVQAEIRRLTAHHLTRADVTAERTLRELARVAYADPIGLTDPSGQPRALRDLPPDLRAAVADVQVVVQPSGTTHTRIRLADKLRALDLLTRHLGLLAPERHEHEHAHLHALTPETVASLDDATLARLHEHARAARALLAGDTIEGELVGE